MYAFLKLSSNCYIEIILVFHHFLQFKNSQKSPLFKFVVKFYGIVFCSRFALPDIVFFNEDAIYYLLEVIFLILIVMINLREKAGILFLVFLVVQLLQEDVIL